MIHFAQYYHSHIWLFVADGVAVAGLGVVILIQNRSRKRRKSKKLSKLIQTSALNGFNKVQ
jgi:hypothetical protein